MGWSHMSTLFNPSGETEECVGKGSKDQKESTNGRMLKESCALARYHTMIAADKHPIDENDKQKLIKKKQSCFINL